MARISKLFCQLMGSPNISFFTILIFSTREKIDNFYSELFVDWVVWFFVCSKETSSECDEIHKCTWKKVGK